MTKVVYRMVSTLLTIISRKLSNSAHCISAHHVMQHNTRSVHGTDQ